MSAASVRVIRVRGAALLQDGGRRGHMHEGVPPGGALVPELLARANSAAGNAWDAPAIEVYGRLTLAPHEGSPRIATEKGPLDSADPRAWEIAGARYVAIAGGFEAPLVLGGRGALPSAGIGAWLRDGDVLPSALASSAATRKRKSAAYDDDARDASLGDAPIRVVRGPDDGSFADAAWPAFLATAFTFAGVGDRVGTRLRGVTLAHRRDGREARTASADARSLPMTRGAIQVPSSGELIVLGPDHPTTGGYPILATVIRADLGRLALREAHSGASSMSLCFVEVSVELARDTWREHRALHGMLAMLT